MHYDSQQGGIILLIRSRETGSLGANCYLAACEQTRQGLLIDPGDDAAQLIAMVKEEGVTVKYIVNTHGHVDHVGANAAVREALAAPIVIHEDDSQLYRRPQESLTLFFGGGELAAPDLLVKDGAELHVGSLTVKVLATPGHTRGSICLLVENALFSGDTLFAGSIGRTDFPVVRRGRLLLPLRRSCWCYRRKRLFIPAMVRKLPLAPKKPIIPFCRDKLASLCLENSRPEAGCFALGKVLPAP